MLDKLCARARHSYATFCSNAGGGLQTTLTATLPDDIHDLSAFGGTKGGVIKSPANSPPKDAPSSLDSSPSAVSGGDCPSILAQSPAAGSNTCQYVMPYNTGAAAQNATLTQTSPDFGPSMFVQTPTLQEQQSMIPSFEGGYSVPSEGTQFSSSSPPHSQESAHQQNPMVLLPREGLEFDLEALGLPSVSQQPMQYSLYPQLEQFRDIFMDENTDVQPPQVPHHEVWWRFIDDLEIEGFIPG